MKKYFLSVLILGSLIMSVPVSAQPYNTGYQQYINYVGQAREAVSQKYPKAAVVDFLYVGCRAHSASFKEFIYKFWMREGTREFGAYVTVVADRQSNSTSVSKVEETDSSLQSYEKWKQIATQSVKSKYPTAQIVDSHPYDCIWLSPNVANQSFTFWLRENNVDRFVMATVVYKINTGEIISVQIEPRR